MDSFSNSCLNEPFRILSGFLDEDIINSIGLKVRSYTGLLTAAKMEAPGIAGNATKAMPSQKTQSGNIKRAKKPAVSAKKDAATSQQLAIVTAKKPSPLRSKGAAKPMPTGGRRRKLGRNPRRTDHNTVEYRQNRRQLYNACHSNSGRCDCYMGETGTATDIFRLNSSNHRFANNSSCCSKTGDESTRLERAQLLAPAVLLGAAVPQNGLSRARPTIHKEMDGARNSPQEDGVSSHDRSLMQLQQQHSVLSRTVGSVRNNPPAAAGAAEAAARAGAAHHHHPHSQDPPARHYPSQHLQGVEVVAPEPYLSSMAAHVLKVTLMQRLTKCPPIILEYPQSAELISRKFPQLHRHKAFSMEVTANRGSYNKCAKPSKEHLDIIRKFSSLERVFYEAVRAKTEQAYAKLIV